MSLKIKRINITLAHHYCLSRGGFIQIPILAFGFGSNGIGIWLVGFYLGISLTNKF